MLAGNWGHFHVFASPFHLWQSPSVIMDHFRPKEQKETLSLKTNVHQNPFQSMLKWLKSTISCDKIKEILSKFPLSPPLSQCLDPPNISFWGMRLGQPGKLEFQYWPPHKSMKVKVVMEKCKLKIERVKAGHPCKLEFQYWAPHKSENEM